MPVQNKQLESNRSDYDRMDKESLKRATNRDPIREARLVSLVRVRAACFARIGFADRPQRHRRRDDAYLVSVTVFLVPSEQVKLSVVSVRSSSHLLPP